ISRVATTTCGPGWRVDMSRERELNPAMGEQAAEAWETFHGADEAASTEHREFGAWMLRSPEHIAAYLRVARTMRRLRSADVRWPDTSAETLIREARAYTAQVVTPLHEELPAPVPRQRSRVARIPLAFAFAAMLLVAIGVAWFVW